MLELGQSQASGGGSYAVPEPENKSPRPAYKTHKSAHPERRVERGLQNQRTRYQIIDDTGEDEMPGHGLRTRHGHESHWTIALDDPLSARSGSAFTCWMSRRNWFIHTESQSEWWCDATHYYIKARVLENDELVNERVRGKSILRDCM